MKEKNEFGLDFSGFSSSDEPVSFTDHLTYVFYDNKTMVLMNYVVKKIGVNKIGDVNE
jgi:hypothetical protein